MYVPIIIKLCLQKTKLWLSRRRFDCKLNHIVNTPDHVSIHRDTDVDSSNKMCVELVSALGTRRYTNHSMRHFPLPLPSPFQNNSKNVSRLVIIPTCWRHPHTRRSSHHILSDQRWIECHPRYHSWWHWHRHLQFNYFVLLPTLFTSAPSPTPKCSPFPSLAHQDEHRLLLLAGTFASSLPCSDRPIAFAGSAVHGPSRCARQIWQRFAGLPLR